MSARTFDFCTRASREASPLACRTSSSSHARSKWSSSERLLRPVMTRTSDNPAVTASSTTYWIAGLSTTGSISFGVAFVAGRKRVPRPAAGTTALVTRGRWLCAVVTRSLSEDRGGGVGRTVAAPGGEGLRGRRRRAALQRHDVGARFLPEEDLAHDALGRVAVVELDEALTEGGTQFGRARTAPGSGPEQLDQF